MSDPDAVAALADEVTEQLGGSTRADQQRRRPDRIPEGILAIDDATWRAQIDTNLLSSIRIDRACSLA